MLTCRPRDARQAEHTHTHAHTRPRPTGRAGLLLFAPFPPLTLLAAPTTAWRRAGAGHMSEPTSRALMHSRARALAACWSLWLLYAAQRERQCRLNERWRRMPAMFIDLAGGRPSPSTLRPHALAPACTATGAATLTPAPTPPPPTSTLTPAPPPMLQPACTQASTDSSLAWAGHSAPSASPSNRRTVFSSQLPTYGYLSASSPAAAWAAAGRTGHASSTSTVSTCAASAASAFSTSASASATSASAASAAATCAFATSASAVSAASATTVSATSVSAPAVSAPICRAMALWHRTTEKTLEAQLALALAIAWGRRRQLLPAMGRWRAGGAAFEAAAAILDVGVATGDQTIGRRALAAWRAHCRERALLCLACSALCDFTAARTLEAGCSRWQGAAQARAAARRWWKHARHRSHAHLRPAALARWRARAAQLSASQGHSLAVEADADALHWRRAAARALRSSVAYGALRAAGRRERQRLGSIASDHAAACLPRRGLHCWWVQARRQQAAEGALVALARQRASLRRGMGMLARPVVASANRRQASAAAAAALSARSCRAAYCLWQRAALRRPRASKAEGAALSRRRRLAVGRWRHRCTLEGALAQAEDQTLKLVRRRALGMGMAQWGSQAALKTQQLHTQRRGVAAHWALVVSAAVAAWQVHAERAASLATRSLSARYAHSATRAATALMLWKARSLSAARVARVELSAPSRRHRRLWATWRHHCTYAPSLSRRAIGHYSCAAKVRAWRCWLDRHLPEAFLPGVFLPRVPGPRVPRVPGVHVGRHRGRGRLANGSSAAAPTPPPGAGVQQHVLLDANSTCRRPSSEGGAGCIKTKETPPHTQQAGLRREDRREEGHTPEPASRRGGALLRGAAPTAVRRSQALLHSAGEHARRRAAAAALRLLRQHADLLLGSDAAAVAIAHGRMRGALHRCAERLGAEHCASTLHNAAAAHRRLGALSCALGTLEAHRQWRHSQPALAQAAWRHSHTARALAAAALGELRRCWRAGCDGRRRATAHDTCRLLGRARAAWFAPARQRVHLSVAVDAVAGLVAARRRRRGWSRWASVRALRRRAIAARRTREWEGYLSVLLVWRERCRRQILSRELCRRGTVRTLTQQWRALRQICAQRAAQQRGTYCLLSRRRHAQRARFLRSWRRHVGVALAVASLRRAYEASLLASCWCALASFGREAKLEQRQQEHRLAAVRGALHADGLLYEVSYRCIARWRLLVVGRAISAWASAAVARAHRRRAGLAVALQTHAWILRRCVRGWRSVLWHSQLLRHAHWSLRQERRASRSATRPPVCAASASRVSTPETATPRQQDVLTQGAT